MPATSRDYDNRGDLYTWAGTGIQGALEKFYLGFI